MLLKMYLNAASQMRGFHGKAESMQLCFLYHPLQRFIRGCIRFRNTVFPSKEVIYIKMLKDQFFRQCFPIPDGTGIFPDGAILHQALTVRDWFHTEIVQC